MELRDFVLILRRSWSIIVTLTLFAVLCAGVYSLIQTSEYEANSTVFVSIGTAPTVSDLAVGNTFSEQIVESYADTVTTEIVLQPVIDKLDLGMNVQELASRVTATTTLDTVLIDITAVADSPALAADIANAVTSSLGNAVEELSPSSEDDAAEISLVTLERATPPLKAASPVIPLNLAIGAIVGLAIALAISVLREILESRVRGLRDVEGVTAQPILGEVRYDGHAKKQPIATLADPAGVRAESFRSLRTNLQFLRVGRGSRSMVVTSSIPGEGRTSSAANLAIAVADSRNPVVVVDADLRGRSLAGYLGLKGSVGLVDVLLGTVPLDDALQAWGTSGLTVLPAGGPTPNPTELLQSTAMVELIAALERRFGTVIFDSPPLLSGSDAAILSRRTSGAIVLAAAGRVRRPQLSSALGSLRQVDARVLGIVLTMVPRRGPDSEMYPYADPAHHRPELTDPARGTAAG